MAGVFLNIIEHLLPRAEAWKTAISRDLTKTLDGLSESWQEAKDYVDQVYLDYFPATTRYIREWEKEFGLPPAANETNARLNVDAAHKATGGQSPYYIQTVLQAAGFDVYVHGPWETTDPYVARDPRPYVTAPVYGTIQFASPAAGQEFFTAEVNPDDGTFNAQPRFDGAVTNVNYWDNLTLQPRMPPQIPSNPVYWPFFLYIGGATFPNQAVVPTERMAELERLICQLRPLHYWIVLLATATLPDDVFQFDTGDGFDQSAWA